MLVFQFRIRAYFFSTGGGALNVRGRWTSGGRPFSDDRSGAETVRLARTGVERRLRTLKNL